MAHEARKRGADPQKAAKLASFPYFYRFLI